MRNTSPRHASGIKVKEPSKAMPIVTGGLATLVASAALASPAVAATANGDGSFKVERGDTLSQIASTFGDGKWSGWTGFRSGNPNLIFPGEDVRPGDGAAATTSDLKDLAKRVLKGEFGNGQARRTALGDKYDSVQAIVNQMLGAPAAATARAGSTSVNPASQPARNASSKSQQWVIDKPAYDETITDKAAWTETVHHPAGTKEEKHPAQTHTVHHDAVTHQEVKHHEATTTTKHIDATYRTVHHDAVTHTEKIYEYPPSHWITINAPVSEGQYIYNTFFDDGHVSYSREDEDAYMRAHPLVSFTTDFCYFATAEDAAKSEIRRLVADSLGQIITDKIVVDKPAWDEQVLVTPARDETVPVPAWDETVTITDKPAWDETIVDKAEWSEQVAVPAWDEQVQHPAQTHTVHHDEVGHWAR
ncbi:hypothetical protein KIM372_15910 [Bombiscardovia nodaiensis]|uniref:Cpl-7 lysozyme C-terminal domain-containing protein n=1 Tax=Bombiscardovia nodaiensis TaxID=2932181 RepID=A0ABN6SC58_9BIFI|nr:hypothetical protein KIM372_15910 [Bombiscardovia nodaiensis]